MGSDHVIMKEGPDVGKKQDDKEWTRMEQEGGDVNWMQDVMTRT